MVDEIRIERRPSRTVAAVQFRAALEDMPARLADAFGATLSHLRRAGLAPECPAVAVYEDLGDGVVTASAGFYVPRPIAGEGDVVALDTPACELAVSTHLGSYDSLPEAYAALERWLAPRGYRPAGMRMWEEYFSCPGNAPLQTRTDICWPIERCQPRG